MCLGGTYMTHRQKANSSTEVVKHGLIYPTTAPALTLPILKYVLFDSAPVGRMKKPQKNILKDSEKLQLTITWLQTQHGIT